MKRILVTGAGGPASTNFIRSLRLAPEPFHIVGVDISDIHLALSQADVNYKVLGVEDPDYLPALNRLIKKHEVEFVHSQPDVEVQFLSEHREQLDAPMLLPPRETIQICSDKLAFADRMIEAGVSVAATYTVTDEASLSAAIESLLAKHEKVWVRARRGAGGRASLPVTVADHAVMWSRYWDTRGVPIGDFMVQEFLPGREFAFQSVWNHGEILTSQARERIEYLFGYLTPSGQTSSPAVARTVHRDDVNEVAAAAVRAVDPAAHGIFCVDIKENSDGVPCVTEINAGRFFTTSIFFSQAGCNMPYYYTRMAYDEPLPDLPKFNALPEDLYWVRMIDMGDRLLQSGEWQTPRP